MIKKVKITVPCAYVIENVKEIVGAFYKKGLQKTNQFRNFELKKQERKNVINDMLS